VPQISRERLNGFALNSQGRSLAQTSLNVKVKGQGHQGQKMCLVLPSAAYEWYALAANRVQQQWTAPLCHCREGVISGACVQSIFGERSIALAFY